METEKLWIGFFLFGVTFWLGLYLLTRDPKKGISWFSGGSVLTASFAILFIIFDKYALTIDLALFLIRARQFLLVTSIFLWLVFLIRLVPGEAAFRHRMRQTPQSMLVILTATVLITLGSAGLFFLNGNSEYWINIGLGILLTMAGSAVAHIIATEQREAFWPDFIRSYDYAFFMALIFSIQVTLVMYFATGISFVMLNLLAATIATAVLVQVFAMRLAGIVDEIAFATFPTILKQRAVLRATSEAVTKIDETVDLMSLPSKEFTKLTRQAIQDLGNLPRLAANPLTQLPLIRQQLQSQGNLQNSLAQAHELKRLLTEGIALLKPPLNEAEFGTTDEWRHYNSLYFPYVVGIRPYRRYVNIAQLSTTEREALNWFRVEVPPRTLYNWQHAAAKLIAKNIKEKSRHLLQTTTS